MDEATESVPNKAREDVRTPRAGADRGRQEDSTPIQPLASSSGAETMVSPSKLLATPPT